MKPTILIVEDNANAVMAMQKLLELQGYHVISADSVAEADSLLGSEHIDLLISDINLPDGTGLDIMSKIPVERGLRSIALSGYTSADDIEAARSAGFDEHLAKPISFDDLLVRVKDFLPIPRTV